MALKFVKYDDVSGKFSTAADPSGSGYTGIDQNYDVGVGGQINFTVTQTFDANDAIDIWINGVKCREGASYDFTRNVSLNRITFNYTVPQNAWVLVRTYAVT
jgi:hypothetical protein